MFTIVTAFTIHIWYEITFIGLLYIVREEGDEEGKKNPKLL